MAFYIEKSTMGVRVLLDSYLLPRRMTACS